MMNLTSSLFIGLDSTHTGLDFNNMRSLKMANNMFKFTKLSYVQFLSLSPTVEQLLWFLVMADIQDGCKHFCQSPPPHNKQLSPDLLWIWEMHNVGSYNSLSTLSLILPFNFGRI